MPAGLIKVLKPLGSRCADAERIGAVEFFGEHVCRWAVEVHSYITQPCRVVHRAVADALQHAHHPAVGLAHALVHALGLNVLHSCASRALASGV
jgi:hypothetical protein